MQPCHTLGPYVLIEAKDQLGEKNLKIENPRRIKDVGQGVIALRVFLDFIRLLYLRSVSGKSWVCPA